MSIPPRLHHWRSQGGAEIDLLAERDGRFVPIEVKSTARPNAADARGIRAFRETYPQLRHGIGVIVAAVTEAVVIADDIIAIPYDIA